MPNWWQTSSIGHDSSCHTQFLETRNSHIHRLVAPVNGRIMCVNLYPNSNINVANLRSSARKSWWSVVRSTGFQAKTTHRVTRNDPPSSIEYIDIDSIISSGNQAWHLKILHKWCALIGNAPTLLVIVFQDAMFHYRRVNVSINYPLRKGYNYSSLIH